MNYNLNVKHVNTTESAFDVANSSKKIIIIQQIVQISAPVKLGLNNANLMRTKCEEEVGRDLILCTSERSHPTPPPEALSLHAGDFTNPKWPTVHKSLTTL